jgi:hypothetical protein
MSFNAALLAFGASLLVGSFVLLVASLTLVALHEIGYIPDFKEDLTAYQNFQVVGMHAYYECLRAESTLFNTLYNSLGGAFDVLSKPIDDLSWVQPAFHIAASFLFVTLAFFGATRRRIVSGSASALSCFAIFATIPLGLPALDSYLYKNTPCSARSIQAAGNRTAEDQVRWLAEMHGKNIGTSGGAMMLTGVEPQQRSLVLRVRVGERTTSRDDFNAWVRNFRRKRVTEFCSSDHGAHYRRLGMSQVWVLRYADTDLVETVVESADQCKR